MWGATITMYCTGRVRPISIHAPRVGRDAHRRNVGDRQSVFQSTRPVWGATSTLLLSLLYTQISIHAPRVGRDTEFPFERAAMNYISIHAPRVGRDYMCIDGCFVSA